MWREMDGKRLKGWVEASTAPVIVFFYTPTCGNCKMARRILDDVMKQSGLDATIILANLNGMPAAAVEWKIERVPALLQLQSGQVVQRTYDFMDLETLRAFIESSR